MATTLKTVLVSGAGIAGSTIAYWLLKHGFTPVLIEKAPHFRQGGYMIDFWGVGFDVAERMGLLPGLRKTGYLIDRVEFVNKHGNRRSSFGGKAFERVLGDRFFSIQRGDLANAIYHAVNDKMETIFGDSIASLTQQRDCVEVIFEHGEPRTFDLVIGADGVGSSVRKKAFASAPEHFERYLGYYAASFVTTGYPWRTEHTYLSYAAPGRQISRYALSGDRTAFLFVLAIPHKLPEIEHNRQAQKALLRNTFSCRAWKEWPEIEKRLDTCDDLYFDSTTQIVLPSWSEGRVALVGDEAYCPSLLAGEGTAFGMAGAYILAAELECSGGDYAAAFAAYERKFRPFIERKQKAARKFTSSFAPRTQFGLIVRDMILGASAIPAVADFLIGRFVADRFRLPVYRSATA